MHKNIFFRLLCLGLIVTMSSCTGLSSENNKIQTTESKKEHKVEEKETIYTIYLHSVGNDLSVKLNGVEVYKIKEDKTVSTEITVNEWLLYGENRLTIETENPPKEESIELLFYKGLDRENPAEVLFELKEPLKESLEKMVNIDHEQFKGNLLENLPVINPNDEETKASLFAMADKIYQAFDAQDKQTIMNLFEKRQEDFGKCYGKPATVYKENLESSLDNLLGNEAYKLLSFKKDKYEMRLAMNDKLAYVKRYKYNKHFINYYQKDDTSIMNSFYIYFALDEKGEWFICR